MAWYVWTINPQRYKRVIEFLESLYNVESYLYPTVIKESVAKIGRKLSDVPLYGNYIFVKYRYNDILFAKLNDYPWLKDCIGQCSNQEIKNIKKLSKQRYEDIMPSDGIKEGNSYKLINTPFIGMTCTIVEIIGDRLVVAVTIFGSDRLIKCSVDDVDTEG